MCSYVSLEEHLASCESHLQEKSREAEAFHHEVRHSFISSKSDSGNAQFYHCALLVVG